MADLLSPAELPEGFSYPPQFLRVVELGLLDLEPWLILTGDLLHLRLSGLAQRYPDQLLVPLAARQDNDDVACWDVSRGKLIIVHDFDGPDFDFHGDFPDFYAWLRQAVEDLIEFDL